MERNCKNCKNMDCYWVGMDDEICDEYLPKTNADKIRSMTDKELASMWFLYVDCGECPMHKECNMLPRDCLRLVLAWLKQEVSFADENN